MEKTVRELAEFLHGKLENDASELKVTGVNGLVVFPLLCRPMWSTAI